MKTDSIFIRLTPELKQRLQELADKDKRTLSDYVRLILTDYIKRKENEKKDWKKKCPML